MSESESDTPFSPDDQLAPLLLSAGDSEPMEASAVQCLESVESIIPPRMTEQPAVPADDEAAMARSVTVPIVPLGTGIADLLTEAVERVVQVSAAGFAALPMPKTARKGSGTAPAQEESAPSTSALRQGVTEGVQEVVAGVGEWVQHSARIMAGLADCLRESVGCMGKVIRDPTQGPCRTAPPQPKATRTAPVHG